MKHRTKIKGVLELSLYNSEGKLIEYRRVGNLITKIMDVHVADQMSDQGEAAIGYMAVGDGTGQTAASVGMASSQARVALDSTTQGTLANDNDVIYIATFAVGVATGTIREAGIMRLDDDASLMCYDDSFTPIVKGAGDSLEITWTVTFGAS